MRRVWPEPDPVAMDESARVAAYLPDDRTTPRVRVNVVMGLDGALVVDGVSLPLSSPEDRGLMAVLRMLCDVLVVGAGTLRAENLNPLRLDSERRDWRRAHGLPEHPTLAVVSGSLAIEPGHRSLARAPVRPLIVTTDAAPAQRRSALAEVADVVSAGHTVVEPDALLAALASRGLTQILCEGGPTLLSTFVAADAVDEMCLTLSPVLAGASAGRMTAGVPTPAIRRLAVRHVLMGDDGMLYLRYGRRPAVDGGAP